MTFVVLGIIALGLGVWVGIGHPGLKGRDDRIVEHGRPRRLRRNRIDLLRRPDRDRR